MDLFIKNKQPFFISCLDAHSDGTHSLYIGSIGKTNYIMQNVSKSVPMKKKKHIYILDGLRVSKYSALLIFGLNIGLTLFSLHSLKSFNEHDQSPITVL